MLRNSMHRAVYSMHHENKAEEIPTLDGNCDRLIMVYAQPTEATAPLRFSMGRHIGSSNANLEPLTRPVPTQSWPRS